MNVPLFDLKGNRLGKTLLITAGRDGDEYAGIEAAYALARKYETGDFAGRLIIFPLANIAGFEAEMSMNPVDKKYPKYIFPGSRWGTSSERLAHKIAPYAKGADVWLDLHGGAITETAFPFVWGFETGAAELDAFTREFCARSDASIAVVDPAIQGSHADILAKHGCVYLLLESGGRGNRNPEDIQRHIGWIELCMHKLSMLEGSPLPPTSATRIVKDVAYVAAPYNGIFRLSHTAQDIQQGDVVGTCAPYDASSTQSLTAPASGLMLWRKDTMAMRKGDTLCAIAY